MYLFTSVTSYMADLDQMKIVKQTSTTQLNASSTQENTSHKTHPVFCMHEQSYDR